MSGMTPQHGPASDLRIADLPEDLRPEAERLKAEYHALAMEANLLNPAGEYEPQRLDDFVFVEQSDLDALTKLAAIGEELLNLASPLRREYEAFDPAIKRLVPVDEVLSPAFAADAASRGFTPVQWVGVQVLERQRPLSTSGCKPLGSHGLFFPKDLVLSNVKELRVLPPGLTVRGNAFLNGTSITSVPPRLTAEWNLYLNFCTKLQTIPPDLRVEGKCDLRGCESLRMLPEGISIGKDLILAGCAALETLPPMLHVRGSLDLSACASLRRLPEGLKVDGCITVAKCKRVVQKQGEALRLSGMIGSIRY